MFLILSSLDCKRQYLLYILQIRWLMACKNKFLLLVINLESFRVTLRGCNNRFILIYDNPSFLMNEACL